MPVLARPDDIRSTAEKVAALSEAERREIISHLSPKQQEDLQYDWGFWGRPTQQEPQQPYFCWLCLAGRGWGKTDTGAHWVVKKVKQARDAKKKIRIALVAETAADARDVMVEGPAGIMAASPPDFMPIYQPTRRRLIWPDGSIAITFSGDEPGQLRGPEFHYAWVDELAKYTYPDETWDNLELGLRMGDEPQVIVTTTPRPIPIVIGLYDDPMTIVTTGSSYENISNLAPKYIRRIIHKYEGTRLGRQELYAEILRDVPGALWSQDLINATRVRPDAVPDIVRYTIAVDPAVSSTEDSNETGIMVLGRGANGDGYLFKDASGEHSTARWAREAVFQYNHWKATRIVGEINNGGDLVRVNIHSVDPNVHYRPVTATKSKGNRAEPIAGLYEQGRMHHVGYFPDLESQMTLITRDEYLGPGSPDRLDALVWGAHDIMYASSTSYDASQYLIVRR